MLIFLIKISVFLFGEIWSEAGIIWEHKIYEKRGDKRFLILKKKNNTFCFFKFEILNTGIHLQSAWFHSKKPSSLVEKWRKVNARISEIKSGAINRTVNVQSFISDAQSADILLNFWQGFKWNISTFIWSFFLLQFLRFCADKSS